MSDQHDLRVETARIGMAPPPVDVSPPACLTEALRGMVQALEDEVSAMGRDPRYAPIALSGGSRLRADALGVAYHFTAAQRPRVREGAEVLFRTGACERTATVDSPVRRHGRQYAVVLRFARDLGVEAPAGELVADTSWMKRRLARFLVDLAAGRDLTLASAAIGLGPIPRCEGLRASLPSGLDLVLDICQCAALQASLNHHVAYVWGPPGTGKTFTLAHCALAHAALGRTLLVVAPSNAAADVAALQIARVLGRHPRLEEGFLLRLGPLMNPELRLLYGDQIELRHVARRLAGEHGDVGATAERLLRNCRIVVTTIQRSYLNRRVAARPYDALLVDEAGMCSLADVFAAASLVGTHVTLFGDGRQLPAVVTATTDAARHWLGRDPLQAHHLHERVLAGEPVQGAVMLTQQRRMAPTIARIVSEGWYDGQLTSDPSLRRRRSPFSDARSTVTLIDTSALHPRTVLAGRERTNPVHAEVVGALLDELAEGAERVPGAHTTLGISVLTPYCGQADLLHQVVRRRRMTRYVRVNTVHGAQGDERDIVILDLSDATGCALSPFLRARRFEDVGARLLNVAISRARHRLYVIADVTFLRHTAPSNGAVRMLFSLIEEHGAVEDAVGVMRNRADRRIAG
jgi:hypothetical protein